MLFKEIPGNISVKQQLVGAVGLRSLAQKPDELRRLRGHLMGVSEVRIGLKASGFGHGSALFLAHVELGRGVLEVEAYR